MSSRVKVTQPQAPNEPGAIEVLATAIRDLAAAMRRIEAGPLKREAIVVLISHRSGIGKRDIEVILNNLRDLDHDWLKEQEK